MTQPEKALHLAVARFLAISLPPRAVWHHSPNGGSRHVLEAKAFRDMGTRAALIETALRGIWNPLRASTQGIAA